MIPIRFGLALGTALLLAPFGAQAQDLSASISSDGSELAEAGEALGLGGTESRSFAGSGETGVFGGASAVNETAADFSALLAIAPATAPVGTESIIGADTRKLVGNTKKFPYRAVVLITFNTSQGSSRCTGWMINKNTVATAGHCVHQGSGGGGGFYSTASYTVYPGRNGGSSPYGSCGATKLWTVLGWANSGKDDYDYGAIKLNCNVGNTVGWFGYFWQKASLKGRKEAISGYPGDKPLTMWKSTGKITVSQKRRLFYKNDTLGGMSGSPVYYKRSGCGWCSMAIHAYGTYNGPPFSKNNHGTRITKSVFRNLNRWKKAAP